jgi:hypothetical protein
MASAYLSFASWINARGSYIPDMRSAEMIKYEHKVFWAKSSSGKKIRPEGGGNPINSWHKWGYFIQ